MHHALRATLEATFGPAEPAIVTAVPPLGLGGGADLLEFRSPPGGGVAYVTFGLSDPAFPQQFGARRFELALLADAPDARLAASLSQLGAATAHQRFGPYHTAPVAEPPGLEGLMFLPPEGREPPFDLLVVVGLTGDELAAGRAWGAALVERALIGAGLGRRTRLGRPTASTLAATVEGRAGRSIEGRSATIDAVLRAVRNRDSGAIEQLRDRVGPADGPLGLALWGELTDPVERDLLAGALLDRREPELRPLWEGVLRGPPPAPHSLAHANAATALERLGRGTFRKWWTDHRGLLAELTR